MWIELWFDVEKRLNIITCLIDSPEKFSYENGFWPKGEKWCLGPPWCQYLDPGSAVLRLSAYIVAGHYRHCLFPEHYNTQCLTVQQCSTGSGSPRPQM